MARPCEQCGRELETRRPDARFCSSTCRGKASKIRRRVVAMGLDPAEATRQHPRPPRVQVDAAGGVAEMVRSRLDIAGLLGSHLAQQALVLARRLDVPGLDSGTGLTAVSRELDRLMTLLLADAAEPDELDEILAEVVQLRRPVASRGRHPKPRNRR